MGITFALVTVGWERGSTLLIPLYPRFRCFKRQSSSVSQFNKEGNAMGDLTLQQPCRRGDKHGQVPLIQEWLCLQGGHVKIDGDFGPATEAAVKAFQTQLQLPATGVVDDPTFDHLVAPMRAALAPLASQGRSCGELAVACAQQHLHQHPREIGGQNKGPWVRLYMQGHQGTEWAWCAGFACFCLTQACQSLGMSLPIEPSFSCDSLAASAKKRGIFLPAPSAIDRTKITPGSFFLVRRSSTDWTHTGIVVQAEREIITTIEGNTNDDGSREGYEVCARTRGYADMDFVCI
jgi:Putative peptidoglycan binding domain